jgi:Glycosyl transferase family 90
MLCNSVILGPRLKWLEFWTHLIVPGQNYVEVKGDWSDLFVKHTELEKDPVRAAAIAKQTHKVAELLDPEGISCYIRELIRRYSDVCQWTVGEPDIGHKRQKKPGQDWMGIEDYIVMKIRY